MKDKVLLVDDEPNILSGYKRGLRQRFDVFTAEGGARGLEMVAQNGPFCVIVADMRMPEMDGVQFLKKIKRTSPDSTRMMLTGNADQETAMQAVNQGAIFRFLTKPCPANDLIAALALGVRQYKLVTAEKEILEKTLSGSIKLLTDILSITEPTLMAKAERIRDYASLVCPYLEIENSWELEIASLLAPLGMLTQPPELRTRSIETTDLNSKEYEVLREVPLISSQLLKNIPRMDKVAELVKVANGYALDAEDIVALDEQPNEMRVMKILADLVEFELRGKSDDDAFAHMRVKTHLYDFELVEKIHQVIERGSIGVGLSGMEVVEVRVKHLMNGDVLKQNVESLDNRLLLSKGTKLTDVYLARLNNYRRLVGIQEPIAVYRRIS